MGRSGPTKYFTTDNGKEDDKKVTTNIMNSGLMSISFYNSTIPSSRKIGEQGQSREGEAGSPKSQTS
jgi:hypothetical protein